MTSPPTPSGRSISVTYRVRFDECGADGSARAASYLRYAQDLAWIHSERLGYDRPWYASHGIGWVVRGIQLDVLGAAASGDQLEVTTEVIGYRRVWARRRTDVRRRGRDRVAWAYTDWVLTDARGRPVRVPPEIADRFPARDEPFDPVRVEVGEPPDRAHVLSWAARPQELDPLGHVNHAVYLDWLDEGLRALAAGSEGSGIGGGSSEGAPLASVTPPASVTPGIDAPWTATPRRYRLEYLMPVPPAGPLVAHVWSDRATIAYRLGDGSGRLHLAARVEPGVGGSPDQIPGRRPRTRG